MSYRYKDGDEVDLIAKIIKKDRVLFNWFISDEELLLSLKGLGLRIARGYLIDYDYYTFVFRNLTLSDAIYIATKLTAESTSGHCTKANYITSCLITNKDTHAFWVKNPGYLLSSVRRIHCGCHETCSLARMG